MSGSFPWSLILCCVFIHGLHGDRKNTVFSFAVEIKLEGRGLRCLLITPSEAGHGPMNMKKVEFNVTFYILIQYLNELDFAIHVCV